MGHSKQRHKLQANGGGFVATTTFVACSRLCKTFSFLINFKCAKQIGCSEAQASVPHASDKLGE